MPGRALPANPLVALLALVIERWAGYPSMLHARVGHPVEWMGSIVGLLDRTLNDRTKDGRARELLGLAAVAALIGAVLAVTVPVAIALRQVPFGWLMEALLATPLLAQKDLARFVAAVADGLDRSLEEGRRAVAHIVGRDPELLDRSGVARAAIESLAENASDGVVAPAFWLAILGLPGIAVYKAINTADSMIGHKSERYLHFGRAAARLDDLVNLPGSRLCGLLIAVASGGAAARALSTMRRDAGKHLSPNAGWPEAAMAGALGIRLGGPRSYHGRTVELPWLGDGRADLEQSDIRTALAIYARMLMALTLLTAVAAVLGLWASWR